MNRENIKKIIEDLNCYSDRINNYHELQTAFVLWWRYGELGSVSDEQLAEIDAIIENHETIFDENLLYDIDDIMNAEV